MGLTKAEYIERHGYDKWLEWSNHRKEYIRKYYRENKERILAQQKEYASSPERRLKRREINKLYREKHGISAIEDRKEKDKKRHKEWYEAHKEYAKKRNQDYIKQHPEVKKKASKNYREKNEDKIRIYRQTKEARASKQATSYRRQDERYNRGVSTITQKWILENIYTKSCVYCGCSDWHKLGCDRIDNTKPHTPDNVVPCCYDCNVKRGKKQN